MNVHVLKYGQPDMLPTSNPVQMMSIENTVNPMTYDLRGDGI
jgi:hypothetical protein